MTKNLISRIILTCMFGMQILYSDGQGAAYTRQVITVNSGKFEFSPPFTDFVTLARYNPADQVSSDEGSIGTQSAQDIIVDGHFAYVTAQDSLVKYNIDTWSRVAAVADSGLSKLYLYKNHLLVSKQFPIVTYFLEVLDTSNLAPVARVADIPGDCGNIIASGDSVYVAVNGGWMGTEGKLAVISPASWTMTHVHNFGPEAVGIFNLYQYTGKIFSVNKTPYGAPQAGTITEFDPATGLYNNHILPVVVGNAAGIKDSLLFLRMNAHLGSYDLGNFKIVDSVVVYNQEASKFISILSATVDSVSNRLYVNFGDYNTPGSCLVTDLKGDSITSYPTGISSECIAVDYRHYMAGISPVTGNLPLQVYPNPAVDAITIRTTAVHENMIITLVNSQGQEVVKWQTGTGATGLVRIAVNQLAPGIYIVTLVSGDRCSTGRFIRQ